MHPLRFVALVLGRPRLLWATLGVAFEAIRLFFLPQYAAALFKHRPARSVDHPVDDRIPFQHDTAPLYLSFIALWMNVVFHTERAYGKRAHAELVLFLAYVRDLYRDAGRVYLSTHSTTRRPARSPNLQCAMIRVLDPHLNCIPSLHVTIVLGAWDRARSLFSALGVSGQARARYFLENLYDHAHRITESTMLMKQHSVNCVGASLWYLSRTSPGLDAAFCLGVADSLFTRLGAGLPAAPEARARAREVFLLLDAWAAEGDGAWFGPILRFVESFPDSRFG